MANKNNNKEPKEIDIVDSAQLKELLKEDPLTVSGLKFDEEKYRKKIRLLKQFTEAEDITEAERKKAQLVMAIYQMALNLEIPATGITILGGKPYINTAGLLYKTFEVAKKHGGVKKISARPLVDNEGNALISQEAGKPAFFIGRVEFKDGSVYEDIGEASVSNIKMSTIRPFLNSMAARRATNRAMRLATGIGLVSAEEIGTEVAMEDENGVAKRLITEKEMEQIADIVAEIEAVETRAQLEAVKKKFQKMKPELNEIQILTIAKVIQKKDGLF